MEWGLNSVLAGNRKFRLTSAADHISLCKKAKIFRRGCLKPSILQCFMQLLKVPNFLNFHLKTFTQRRPVSGTKVAQRKAIEKTLRVFASLHALLPFWFQLVWVGIMGALIFQGRSPSQASSFLASRYKPQCALNSFLSIALPRWSLILTVAREISRIFAISPSSFLPDHRAQQRCDSSPEAFRQIPEYTPTFLS